MSPAQAHPRSSTRFQYVTLQTDGIARESCAGGPNQFAATEVSASFLSRTSAGIAPLTREPSAKNMAGVPVTSRLRPSARLDSMGVSHSATAGCLFPTIHCFQVAALSSAHQMLRER